MIIEERDYNSLQHFGILRKSGRYPWGSGETQSERNRSFLDTVADLKRQGMSDPEIARSFSTPEHPFSLTHLRAVKSIAKNEEKQADISRAQRLKDKGLSNMAIGQVMGKNESSVRALLAPGQKAKTDVLGATADMLRDQVDRKKFVDVGTGVEHYTGVSQTRLAIAVARLKEEGYQTHTVKIEQVGTGKLTEFKVLVPPGVSQKEVWQNKDKIQQIDAVTNDRGRSYIPAQPPLSISSKRVAVRYADKGGADADGVIYVRPGVEDVSIGLDRYAQVRVAVDGTHFLKGMAVYKDDLPHGVDLMFNTNKHDTGNKLDAMKPINDKDPDLPFGAITRPLTKKNAKGEDVVSSSMNIVNDVADWEKWSKTLSSQMLSKQKPSLAKTQLDMTYERRKRELDDIVSLTNPAVKRKLLEEYADGADSAAVHLKAAALPRQKTHVILPVNSVKDNEIYATNYNNGDRVVLVRFPHGGIFEIPELVVNNRNAEAKKLLGNAKNAVGINSNVARRLSGADFDGDTVLVIPNNKGLVKTKSPLEGLKDFDPVSAYPRYEGMPKMTTRIKGQQMGFVSNLITDMTIRGASDAELARAVRHSMVVIDAEKHDLNYKLSAINNGIPNLMQKYQGKSTGGASTIVSRKKRTIDVPERLLRKPKDGGPIDPATGRLVFTPTGASYVSRKTGKTVVKQEKVNQLNEATDARTLSSGTKIEQVYADHSNRMKSLANEARKATLNIKSIPYSPSAKIAYSAEVTSLNAKLNIALRNAPLERQAQVVAGAIVSQKKQANPDMEPSELKKVKGQALTDARMRTGAGKERVDITQPEWDAIQAGAITQNMLKKILDNSDMDVVRALATPRSSVLMTTTKKQRAVDMFNLGYTQAEVAEALGVSVSTLTTNLK